MKMKLTIDVEYSPNGTTAAELRALLHAVADRAAGDGLLTGETPAEVNEWTATVEVFDDVGNSDTCSECGAIAGTGGTEHEADCSYHPKCPYCGKDTAERIGDTAIGTAIRYCADCDAEWEHLVI